MMGAVSPSRRANAFAQALDEREFEGAAAERSGGGAPEVPAGKAEKTKAGPTGGPSDERTALLSLAGRLDALPKPAMDPDVKAAQRAQLLAAVENAFAGSHEGASVPAPRSARTERGGAHRASPLSPLSRLRPRTRLTKGLAAGGLSFGIAAGALGGAAVASTDALPGDTLYGLKLGMEDLKLGMAGDEADRGEVHLDHASTRLNEARRLLERGRSGPLDHESLGDIRRTLSHMRDDVSEGHRLLSQAYEREGEIAPIRSLSSFSRSHRAKWDEVRAGLPVQLTDVGDEVSSLFDAIEDEVGPLRPLLDSAREDTDSAADTGRGDRPDADRTDRPPSPAPGESGADGTEEGDRDGERQPSPSGSPGSTDPDGEGLLPDPGDLLEPSPGEGGASKTPDGAPRLPEPDITIPPLLPNLLPGLGIEAGDDSE
ncbi:hypothetical protein IQ279_24740 [Streptomyces verrucosisporus]|uniref:DUF5667 domain-containing protein n=1 Tax=Streptomyces verrucosisporus TaxID=1695161 RepID=UPI0019CFC180|nr:DUF5667 domain-containing protein [Streptomyces verrucosisporus]MBN3932780.1 hypothetical protein [Streptomyces verrucosisporus]